MHARRTTMAAKQRRGSEPQAGLLPRHREEPRRRELEKLGDITAEVKRWLKAAYVAVGA